MIRATSDPVSGTFGDERYLIHLTGLSSLLGALAGLLLGIAAQTKYTAFVAPAVAIVYAFLFGRRRLGFLTLALAAAVFIGWECFIAATYGEPVPKSVVSVMTGTATPALAAKRRRSQSNRM